MMTAEDHQVKESQGPPCARDKRHSFQVTVDYMEEQIEIQQKENKKNSLLFVCMFVPLADSSKPGLHFLVAGKTDNGIFFRDPNAVLLGDEDVESENVLQLSQDKYVQALIETSKQMDIPVFNFAAVKLTEAEFRIFYPGVVGVSSVVCESQNRKMTLLVLRRCMVALKSFFHVGRSENATIEMVIFEVFHQTVCLSGDPRSEGFSVKIGHDFREDISKDRYEEEDFLRADADVGAEDDPPAAPVEKVSPQ